MSIKDTITRANREEELKKNPILALFDVIKSIGDTNTLLQSIFDRKVEPPVVNVEAPVVNIPAPIINVPAPIVNIPEQVAPVVNVPAPIVNIEAPIIKVPEQPAPIVNVDTSKFEEGIDTTNKTLKEIFDDLKARGLDVGKVQLVDKDGKPIDLTRIYSSQGVIGGRGYETVWVKNVAGTKQNPATSEKQGQYLDSETGLWTDTVGMDGIPASITYEVMIARHLIAGHEAFRGFGERVNCTAIVAGNDVCQATATVSPMPAQPTGDLMTIVSTSASDGIAGVGVQSVDVHYLDANGAAQSTIVTMNGVTPVDIPLIYMRFIQSIHTETVGTGGTTVGTITIYKTGSPTIIYNQLNPGGNVSLNAARMVPAGKSFYMRNLSVMAADNTAVSVRLRATSDFEDVLTTGYFFLFKDVSVLQNASREKTFVIPLHFPALSVIKFTAYSTTAGASVSVNFDGWVE